MKGISGTEYISKHNNGFRVTIRRKGKKIYMGYGRTLIVALMKRDWCKANGWKPYPQKEPTYITKTANDKFIIQKGHYDNGKRINSSYGVFNSYGDAQKEVELLKKYDWDYEALCDNADDRINGTVYLPELRTAGVWK